MTTTQLVVIGAGPGGYTAAFRAADLGLRVVLVERDPTLGGVCLNVGCIPSKALLHAAKVVADARDLAAHGISFGAPSVDLPALRAWKGKVVDQLTNGLQSLARQRRVETVTAEARFVDANTLALAHADGTRSSLRFEQAIVAAGSEPVRLPDLPYEDPRIIDSTGALALTDIPRRLLVIGGGIIGLEMATVYAELGSAVTVVELADGLIPGADRDLVKPLEKRLRSRLAAIHLATRVAGVAAREDALEAHFEGKNAPPPGSFDRILVAVGRRPNGGLLDAAKAGLAVDARGYLTVDRQMRTNLHHVFAVGDIVGNPMLAHKASHEGKVAAEAAAGHKVAFDARVIPSVAYTDPEVAWVGVSESEAAATGLEVEKAVFPWAASGRALSLGRSEGLTKLLFDRTDRRLVGAGIVGPGAGDLIAETALAIEMGCDAEDIGLTVHPHPTLSETVAMAAEMFSGSITDLYVPRKKG
jgi:dihydrolipoamide dehydrogenase